MHIRSLLFLMIVPAAACYTAPVHHNQKPVEPATPVAQETSTPTPAPELAIDETCPMAVPGTTVSVEDNVDGATLVFTTTGDVTALRSRVISMANDHNSEHLKMGALPVGTQRTYANGGATYGQGAGSASGSSSGIASQQEGNQSYPNDQNATGAGVASGNDNGVAAGSGSGSGSASSTTIGDENDNGAGSGSGSGSSIASGEGNGSGSGSGIASGIGQGSGTTVAGAGVGSGTSTGSAITDHNGDETGVENNQGPGQLPNESQGTYASGGAYGQSGTSGTASNGEDQGLTGKAMILTHSRAQIEPFDGGVRLVFIADPQNVQALRDEVRLHAEHMKTGRCD